MDTKTENIALKRDKECRGSVRFKTTDENVAVDNVYVSRSVPGIETAKSVTVTVQVN